MNTPLDPLTPLDCQQRYSIAEAIRYLRISRATLYADISCGRIAVIREPGRHRSWIHGSEIIRLSAPTQART